MTARTSTTFLRVAELWQVRRGDGILAHAGGYYSTATAFKAASRATTFQLGQGLIGRCASLGAPILLDGLTQNAGFLRSDAARRDGLTVGLALPMGPDCVLALFFASACDAPSGGVEIWRQSFADGQLELRWAHHGIAEDFRRISAQTRFPLGEGLPGRVAQSRAPELLEHLNQPSRFLRAIAAETSGFEHAIGLPLTEPFDETLVLIGHRQQPVVEHVELWQCEGDDDLSLVARWSATPKASLRGDCRVRLNQALAQAAPVVFEGETACSGTTLGGLVLPFFPSPEHFSCCLLMW